MAGRKPKQKTQTVNVAVEYHVVPDGQRRVERNDAFTGQFAYVVNAAFGFATAAPMCAQRSGTEASVCVQQQDGNCQHVRP